MSANKTPKRVIPILASFICPKCMEVRRMRITGRPMGCMEKTAKGEYCPGEVVLLSHWNASNPPPDLFACRHDVPMGEACERCGPMESARRGA